MQELRRLDRLKADSQERLKMIAPRLPQLHDAIARLLKERETLTKLLEVLP